MIRLERLHLENYRGFTNSIISFGEHLTCIAGVNGAGKSSVLRALSKVLESLYTSFPEEPFLRPSDFNKKVKNGEMKIAVDFLLDKKTYTRELTSKGVLFLEDESFSEYRKTHDFIVSYYSVNRSELDVDVSTDKEKDLSAKNEAMTNAFNSVTHYKEFFQWFRDREDRENAIKLEKYENGDTKKIFEDHELKAVRNAISVLTPEFSKMKIDSNRQSIIITKKDATMDFSTLSDGEKGIITLFGDIARRLAIANEKLENPLKGNGIILIDEIDLHLHPSWQRKVCSSLVKTFPNCQFVITTHSPQILGELQPEDIRLLNNFEVSIPSQSFGLDSNTVLDTLQNSTNESLKQNSEISKKIDVISSLIDDSNFSEARNKLQDLEKELHGATPETVSLSTEIALMEDAE